MPKLDLRLRNLQTGETVNAMFESEVDAVTWLTDRPRFMEPLGVATHGLPEEVYTLLRAVKVPPFDDEERALREAILRNEEAAWGKVQEDIRREAEAEQAAHRDALKNADPNRPMTIEWNRESGLRIVDPADTRAITDVARDAVIAWVRERDVWVRDRAMVVGEAEVTVWPGEIPADKGPDRVLAGGQFIPVTV